MYISYKKRFLIAIIATVANLTNQVVWAAFSSIASTASTFYETTLFGINMMALIYMIAFIPMSPVASWVLDEKGIRYSILIGTVSTFVGALVKWTSGFAQGGAERYAICFIGQAIASIGQPFVCNGMLNSLKYSFNKSRFEMVPPKGKNHG
jgi:hypothetical protein